MALIIGSPKFQWFIAATGQPAVDYLLYSYTATTLTPCNTWQDTGLTTLNTNPVVLDASGTADVVISGLTKLVLKDPSGSVIWTYDSIGSAGANVYDENGNAYLTFATTASAVNYFKITNASTGNSPIFEALGGDTNVGATIRTKGTGALNLTPGGNLAATVTSTSNIVLTAATGSIKLVTNSNNFTAPASVPTANRQALIATTAGVSSYSTHTLPSSDGVAGTSLTTDGSANLTLTMVPPTGAVLIWSTTTAPSGYLECDGSAVSRSTYSALFAIIGTTFGVGNGTTTFNLPQTQRQVIVGRGGSGTATLANTIAAQGGTETVTLVTANMPASVPTSTAWSSAASSTFNPAGGASAYNPGTNTGDWAKNAATAVQNLQPSLVMMYIIKT